MNPSHRPAAASAPPAADPLPPEKQSGPLTWEYGVPLLTDPFMLWEFGKLIAGTLLLVQFTMLVVSFLFTDEVVWLPWQVVAGMGGGLALAIVFVVLVVYGNRFHMDFTLNERGVHFRSGRKERFLNRVARWGGLLAALSGRPGAAAAASLGELQEEGTIRWRDIKRVIVHPRWRVVTLKNSWRTVLRLHCPRELFTEVAARAQAHTVTAPRRRAVRKAVPSA